MYVFHESTDQSSVISICLSRSLAMQKHGGIKFKKFITPPTMRRDECPVSNLQYTHTHTQEERAMNSLTCSSHELHVTVT